MPELIAQEQITKFLRNAQGSEQANGNYSGDSTEFFYSRSDRSVCLRTLLVAIVDNGAFSRDGYGGTSALTNGIGVRIKEGDNVILDLTNSRPIKSNAAWGFFAYDEWNRPVGPGDGAMVVRWRFAVSTGADIKLLPGQRFVVELNDDFTGLLAHLFLLYGTFSQGG
jgi:hypothetical protein